MYKEICFSAALTTYILAHPAVVIIQRSFMSVAPQYESSWVLSAMTNIQGYMFSISTVLALSMRLTRGDFMEGISPLGLFDLPQTVDV